MKVGVLGLGTMGEPMARNLLRAGFDLRVHNRTRDKELALAAEGAERAASPAELAEGLDVLVVCVSDTPDLESVLLDPTHGAMAALPEGSLVIDCSTVAPAAARSLAAEAGKRGIGFVDAPVSGGSEGAIHGSLAVMCGGSDEDFARARPVLEAVGKSITHVGPSGAGQVAKAVNQVLISGTYQAVAEGMVLADRLGVDPERVLDAVSGGAAASWVLSNRARNMIENDYPLGFRMALHRKDLRIALEAARDANLDLSFARQVAATEDALIAEGFADEDMSAIARRLRQQAGIGERRLDGRASD
jgi:3-hydroxyisobutyrate dehydrogenase-like beta-hydroxyacid dehydrogenase